MLCMSKASKEAQNHLTIFAHNFLNIQQIFNPTKSFGKLRLSMSEVLKVAQNN